MNNYAGIIFLSARMPFILFLVFAKSIVKSWSRYGAKETDIIKLVNECSMCALPIDWLDLTLASSLG